MTSIARILVALEDSRVVISLVGFLGVAIGFLHHFGLLHGEFVDRIVGPQPVIFFLLSSMAAVVGVGFLAVEEIVRQSRNDIQTTTKTLADQITATGRDLGERLLAARPYSFVEGSAIWFSLTRLVHGASHRIRATHFGAKETERSYVEALATVLQQNDQLDYDVVIGYDPNDPSAARRLATDRMEIFQARRVAERVTIRFMPVLWGLDLLVVDSEIVFIGLPTRMRSPALRCGVVIRDPEFGARIAEWYDSYLVTGSVAENP